MNWTTLVSAEALAAALGDPALVVVDARFVFAAGSGAVGDGEAAWRRSHLPGAGYVHLDDDLSDRGKPASQGRHPMPDAAAFARVLARLGITPAHQVVVYDADTGAMAAARFWWLLRLMGHRRVAVLDGGFARWTALGLPVTADVVPVPAVPPYPGTFDRAAVAGNDEVAARLHAPRGWLLDARASERFRGDVEPLDPVAGHIPGARNRPFADNLRDGRFRPVEELRDAFAVLTGPHAPADVVLSCGSGVTACHNLLAMEHAGLPGARIYAGSWSGWVSDRTRPVERGD